MTKFVNIKNFFVFSCLVLFIASPLSALVRAGDPVEPSVPICVYWEAEAYKSGVCNASTSHRAYEIFSLDIRYSCITDQGMKHFYVMGRVDGDFVAGPHRGAAYGAAFIVWEVSEPRGGEECIIDLAYDELGMPVLGGLVSNIGAPWMSFEIAGHTLVGGVILDGPGVEAEQAQPFGTLVETHGWTMTLTGKKPPNEHDSLTEARRT